MIGRFQNDKRGNIALTTALSFGVLLLASGMAVDLSGSVAEKQELQNALDAAVMNAAVDMDHPNDTALENHMRNRVRSLLRERPEFDNVNVTIEIDGNVVTAVAKDEYETYLLGVFGKDTIDIDTFAQVTRPGDPLIDLVLVLDTTDSMAGTNMASLRTAAIELIDTLEDMPGDGVRVSVVPYGSYVNIGVANEFEPWMFANRPDEPDTTREIMNTLVPKMCSPDGPPVTVPTYQDGILNGTKTYQPETCTEPVLEPTGTFETVPGKSYDPWQGCAGSRAWPDHFEAEASSANPIIGAQNREDWTATNGEAHRFVECGTEMLRLTSDFNTARNRVNSLLAQGDTYMPAGLIWGWRALDPNVPFPDTLASDPDTRRAILFMTDGFNTVRRDQEWHFGMKPTENPTTNAGVDESNLATEEICGNIQDAGIDVYTVAYDLPPGNGDAAEALGILQNCASNPALAFTADNVDELRASFQAIADNLAQIRVSG